ncbi:unnamed protein product [Amoebophrya sp. A25]|nr:unnamed protein product [Amoebophrya sp. A25]|eukprot:GSA25T00002181001.1
MTISHLQTVKFVVAGHPKITDHHRTIAVDFQTTTGKELVDAVFPEELAEGWRIRLFASGRAVGEKQTLTEARMEPESFLHAFFSFPPPEKDEDEKKVSQDKKTLKPPADEQGRSQQQTNASAAATPTAAAAGVSVATAGRQTGLSRLCCCGIFFSSTGGAT